MPKTPNFIGLPPSGAATLRSNSAIPAGNTQTFDIDVSGVDTITVFARLRATTTPGDLVLGVAPYWADGTTVHPTSLPGGNVTAPVAAGADVVTVATYPVPSVTKLRLSIQNNNAGSKNADLNYLLS